MCILAISGVGDSGWSQIIRDAKLIFYQIVFVRFAFFHHFWGIRFWGFGWALLWLHLFGPLPNRRKSAWNLEQASHSPNKMVRRSKWSEIFWFNIAYYKAKLVPRLKLASPVCVFCPTSLGTVELGVEDYQFSVNFCILCFLLYPARWRRSWIILVTVLFQFTRFRL